MKRIILNCVPPFACNIPSPAISILKSWLTKKGYKSTVIYWNLRFYRLQGDFVWNKPSVLETSSQLGLYVNYLLHKKGNLTLIDGLKKIIQSSSPRYLTDAPEYYERHLIDFVYKMDNLIDDFLSKIDFSDVMLIGFSLKLDGWIFASVVAEKIKKINPNIPILIGGIGTKEKAKSLLENFSQFDFAMWGEGEEPLAKLVEVIASDHDDYFDLINTAFRYRGEVVFSSNHNNHYIDLSEENLFPDYSDYFHQKEELNLNFESIIPIEGSRGCHWNKCKFCYLNTDYRYRTKSSEKICTEIRYMMEKYKLYSFEFLDNDFIGLDFERIDKLIDGLISIKKEEPRFKIVIAEVITKGLTHSIIKRMFDAGIAFVQIGYENTSHNLLKKVNKKNTFSSNMLYVKFASLYNIPLGNVNVIVNMPDETLEDILEAIDNLKFLRFFLHAVYFKHMLIPVQIDKSSRYYKYISAEISYWTPSILAYDFLKEYINEKDHWIIFDYIKQSRHYQWETFKNIERYYLENRHSYVAKIENEVLIYTEYIGSREIFTCRFSLKSIEWFVLFYTNDMVVSIQDLYLKMKDSSQQMPDLTEKTLKRSILALKEKGILYSTPDFSEIVSVIYIKL